MTAIAVPVLAASAGVAIDVSNMMVSRSQLQEATDAAALATATALTNGASQDDAQKLATNFVSGQMANYLSQSQTDAGTLASNVQITPTTDSGSTSYAISVSASYSMPVNGMTHLLGFNTVGISASSSSAGGSTAATTGTASKNPLSMYLVLDRSQSMSEDTDTTYTFSCQKTTGSGRNKKTITTTCTDTYTKIESLKMAVQTLGTQLSNADPKSQYVRTGAVSYNNAQDNPTALAWGTTGVTDYVNNLTPKGTTDSSQAMQTAYNALIAPSENQAHLTRNGQVPSKYIVFMTDGDNNQPNADSKTRATCDLARAANITVYTIALMAPSNGQALLRYCATTPENSFTPENAGDLLAAFQTIGLQASKKITLLTK